MGRCRGADAGHCAADGHAIVAAKLGADPAGHPGRPDVTRLLIDRRVMSSAVELDAPIDAEAPFQTPPERPHQA